MYLLYNSCRALQLCDAIAMATDADSQNEVYWPAYVLITISWQIDLKRQKRCNFWGSDMSLKHINIQWDWGEGEEKEGGVIYWEREAILGTGSVWIWFKASFQYLMQAKLQLESNSGTNKCTWLQEVKGCVPDEALSSHWAWKHTQNILPTNRLN